MEVLFLFGILLVVVGAPVAVVVLGVLLVEARRRIRVLTDRIRILETRLGPGAPSPPATGAPPAVRMPKRAPALATRVAGRAATSFPEVGAAPESDLMSDGAGSAGTAALRSLLFGGHTLVRIGVLILFFGFSFFLSYVVEQGWVPIELRLAAAALAGLALLAVGWRLRDVRRDYALALQGGGAGIVYLTVFAAVNYYALIGPGAGLGVMFVLVVLTGGLAVRQDAQSLAVLSSLGGFLGPVLVTRDADHVALFSYYAVLDAGIVAVAWFRAWRLLNLLGFVFTFVVGAWWGATFYRPEYFATTQPFLALFFALFVAVSVLQTRRRPLVLSDYVDRTLLFGVPVVAYVLQHRLASEFEHGPAASALAFCLFYASVAVLLRRAGDESMRMPRETFATLSVAFGALAIPLAAGVWTTDALAIEGAVLVWIGTRRNWGMGVALGLALQLLSGYLFVEGPFANVLSVPNATYPGYLTLSLAGLFSAWSLRRGAVPDLDPRFSVATLGWGTFWWCFAGLEEITQRLSSVDLQDQYAAALGFFVVSAGACALLRERLVWKELAYPPLMLLPAMFSVTGFWLFATSDLLAGWGAVAWPAAVLMQYGLLWRFDAEWSRATPGYHCCTLWFGVFLGGWEAVRLAEQHLPEPWSFSAAALVPACVVWAFASLGARLQWPVQRYREVYLGAAQLPLAVGLAAWMLAASFVDGDPRPLAYVPLLNPVEMVQAISLVALFQWCSTDVVEVFDGFRRRVLGLFGFVALNGVLARMTHHFLDVPFEAGALLSSGAFQALLSFVWTTAACVVMLAATRLRWRLEWRLGAALLTMTVIKLLLFDLADTGTVTRIVSFIVVGAFILVIGYVSPLPPPEDVDARSA